VIVYVSWDIDLLGMKWNDLWIGWLVVDLDVMG